MELGANRKSLTQLAAMLALLAFVVYFQFLREPASPVQPPPQAQAVPAGAPAGGQAPAARQPGARFQPRLGRRGREAALDPMSVDATLRRDRLERLRAIEEPAVERDIFNFGRPKPVQVQGPTRAEMRQAQERLDEFRRAQAPAAPAKPARAAPPPRPQPPKWKYYGIASLPESEGRRAFLLDGEEILVVAEGAIVRGQYRIGAIGVSAIRVEDVEAGHDFSIPLEVPR